ncbi:hypothetical protein LINGRAHAP2_LOCUS3840 [Linum grandiflorum]
MQEDVQHILSIPLPRTLIPEQLIWPFSPFGSYTVHSGYLFAAPSFIQEPYAYPNTLLNSEDWSALWALDFIPKLKIFLWKALRDILPTLDLLRSRGMISNDLCPVCLSQPETVEHLLLQCPIINLLGTRLGLPIQSTTQVNFLITWLTISRGSRPLRDKFIFFCWRLWKARNTVVFSFAQTHPRILEAQFKHQLSEFLQHEAAKNREPSQTPSRTCSPGFI